MLLGFGAIAGQIVNKQGNTIDFVCGNAGRIGIAFECRSFRRHNSGNIRENPEPNTASKGIEMGRESARIIMP